MGSSSSPALPRCGFVPSFGNPFGSVAMLVPHCCPRFWRVLFCGTLTDEDVGLGPFSSRPVAVSPPFWGWVCFGGLTGVVVHLRDAWRGFPRWVGLLAALLEVYLSFFEQLVSRQGASASTPLFPRGKGRGF